MSRDRVILTDIDGTVLDFVDSFHIFMRANGFTRRLPATDPYSLAQPYGLRESQIDAMIEQFFDSSASALLRPEPCAARVLPKLHRNGWRFVGITAAPRTSRKKRMDNLKRAFGFEFVDVHCLGLRADKEEMLRSYYGMAQAWVEDHPTHAMAGAAVGHRSFLLNRPWNKGFQSANIVNVPDWHQIEKELS